MKRLIVSAFALLAVSALAFAGQKSAPDNKMGMKGPMPGDPAPAFSLPDSSGKTVSLTDYSGKVVVLEWFNNECPFVKKHYVSGNMNAIASKYADKGVVWLAINSTSGATATEMKSVAGDWKIDRPILMDTDGTVGHAYESKNTPTMFVIDKEGKIVYRGAIDDKADPDPSTINGATNYVSKALDEVLAGKPVSEPMTKAYGCSVKYAK
jgi:peroxiredoxin